RTYHESWWGNEGIASVNSQIGEQAESEKTISQNSENQPVPPSQRVVMDNKGVGPIENVAIPEGIDEDLAQKGKKLFDTNCISCHLADKKLVGPAPKGILDRRTPEWVMNMIINPGEMLEKDSLAKELLAEFNGVRSEEHTSELQSREKLVCRLL